ncbi:hypothetical protein MKX01_028993 [Papaver californicum]|nr:hypothetical protein MKX01_028993 [Papaver californicum]
MEQLRPNPLIRRFDHSTSNNFYSPRNVRSKTFNERVDNSEASFTSKSLTEGKYRYRRCGVSGIIDYSVPNMMEQLDGDSRQSPRGGRGTNNVVSLGVIDLDGEDEIHDLGPASDGRMEAPGGQIVLHTPGSNNAMRIANSDERYMIGNNKPDYTYDLEVSKMRRDPNYCGDCTSWSTDEHFIRFPVSLSEKPVGEKPAKDVNGSDQRKRNVEKEDKGICGETVIEKSKGVYVGVQDDIMSDSGSGGGEDDGLGDIWMEMNLALECSKDASSALGTATEHTAEEEEEDESLSRYLTSSGEREPRLPELVTCFSLVQLRTASELKADQDFGVAEISVHPRHIKQMKLHQIEGFNFLLRNLVCDSPGGCILSHAPGSGKTFMIISFMQSFLAKYPNARPLVVLPKGILGTWKREFERCQVEEIPLRAQQLDVLKQWMEHKGILFLGYKQFASIVSNSTSSIAAAACHDILLKNHVKEVFNILNLVRPKFLKLDTSKAVVGRVMSKVQIAVRKQIKSGGGDTMFYDLVEETLQNDQDFRRKVTVIQDLREMAGKVLHYYEGDFLDELPGLVDLTVVLTLNPKQKHAVEKLRKLDKFKRSSMGSAVYIKGHIDEAKIDELLNKVELTDGVKTKFFFTVLALCESTGEKMSVFSQYLLPLKFLERLVVKTRGWSLGKEIFVISGDSSQDQREISMERFNSSKDAKVFFGSIKACGEGISLVGASRLLILDIHLNPSVTRQAIGCAFRPGQTKKVYAYRLVAADSPEEEDHHTCFRKELISKMWFEWNEICEAACNQQQFHVFLLFWLKISFAKINYGLLGCC